MPDEYESWLVVDAGAAVGGTDVAVVGPLPVPYPDVTAADVHTSALTSAARA